MDKREATAIAESVLSREMPYPSTIRAVAAALMEAYRNGQASTVQPGGEVKGNNEEVRP